MEPKPEISLSRLSAFMRQHTHDVRNGLNCLDLETALLQEIVNDEEGRQGAERMRQQVRALAGQLRTLSVIFQEPQPICGPLSAKELLLIWREQLALLAEPPEVEWVEEIADEMVNVDAGMMAMVFSELLMNARAFCDGQPAIASVRRVGAEVVFELCEPKSSPVDTEGWGLRLFETSKRGGHGLGLWSARRLVEANGAAISQRYEAGDGDLHTRIAIPVM